MRLARYSGVEFVAVDANVAVDDEAFGCRLRSSTSEKRVETRLVPSPTGPLILLSASRNVRWANHRDSTISRD